MNNLDEITNSLEKAVTYINKALSADSLSDVEHNLWCVNSELEYSLFIFNLSIDDDNHFNWSPSKSLLVKLKHLDLNAKLKLINNYLLKVLNLVKVDFFSAYKKTVALIVLSRMFYRELRRQMK